MKKENKGITLIALVITIIILLILATIVINLTIGQRGILNRAEEARRNYTKSAKEEERQLGDLLNMIDGKGDFGNEAEIENQAPIYARLYTKNGTTDEVLILASKEEAFLDYSSELTLKDDYGNIYEKKVYKTEEDLYKIPEYAEELQSDEWKEYKAQNPEEAQKVIEELLEELNNNQKKIMPWRGNERLVEVRINDEIFPSSIEGWFVCEGLTQLDLRNLNTSKITNMEFMFCGCSGLTTLDVSGWDVSNVTSMDKMFLGCSSLTTLNLNGWDTSNVTNMQSMFEDCKGLMSLDLSNFDTSSVKNMAHMFSKCNGLTTLDVSNFDTSNVTNMDAMFWLCSGLTTLDVSNFDTSNVTNMAFMFDGCSGLATLDVSNFDTSNVTSMNNMFFNFKGTMLDLTNFDTSKVTRNGRNV